MNHPNIKVMYSFDAANKLDNNFINQLDLLLVATEKSDHALYLIVMKDRDFISTHLVKKFSFLKSIRLLFDEELKVEVVAIKDDSDAVYFKLAMA